jgi:hypothetical protein
LVALGTIIAAACTARGTVVVGGPCTRDESCTTGVCIQAGSSPTASAWAGGYCSGNCARTACPQGLCLMLADGLSYCLAACQDGSACRSGYVCSVSAGACLPDCRLGWSCGPALVCDATSGACTLPTTVSGTTPLGGPCALNAECSTALCIPERGSNGSVAWTGGTCSQACGTAACAAGGTCVAFQDGSAYCVPTCASSSDCRAGYACATDVSACLPDCRLGWSCGTLVCDPGSGTCMDAISGDAGIGNDGGADGFARGDGGDGRGGFGPGPGGAWN